MTTQSRGFNLFLVRHGESQNNALPEHQRVSDPALTDLGEKQARDLGHHYTDFNRIEHILVSPFRRTLQTASPLVHHRGIRADIWPDIYEVGGCFSGYKPGQCIGESGMTDTEIRNEFPEFNIPDEIDQEGWFKKRPHETWEMAIPRARTQAAKLVDTFGKQDTVVFCFIHADFKQLLLQQLVPDQSEYHHSGIANSSVTHLHFENGAGRVIDYCNTDHLTDSDISF